MGKKIYEKGSSPKKYFKLLKLHHFCSLSFSSITKVVNNAYWLHFKLCPNSAILFLQYYPSAGHPHVCGTTAVTS